MARLRSTSGRVIELALVANGENADLFPRRQEPVEGDVPGAAEGDDQFPDVALDRPPDQGMVRQHLHGFANRRGGIRGRGDVMLCKEPERAFEIGERVGRIDYLRQGFGREAFGFLASRSSQACTSSAP